MMVEVREVAGGETSKVDVEFVLSLLNIVVVTG